MTTKIPNNFLDDLYLSNSFEAIALSTVIAKFDTTMVDQLPTLHRLVKTQLVQLMVAKQSDSHLISVSIELITSEPDITIAPNPMLAKKIRKFTC